jgi:predicted HD phosphohydrolase
MINQEQMDNNWTELMSIIDKHFEGEQKENILKLHSDFEDEYKTAPASGRPNYHNCFKGGYLDHILHVIKNSLMIKRQYESNGVKVIHSDSDVVLAAMFHDLGKLGDGTQPYYKYQTDDWRRKKLKEWYTHNQDLDYMTVHDRALWLLSKYHIDVNPHVYKAILCADGLFDPAAETYFRSYVDTRHVLGSIVHFGDWLSTICEKQNWLQSEEEHSDEAVEQRKTSDKDIKNMKAKFDELFSN